MDKKLRLLLIEDSEDDAFILLRELKKGGYDTECHRVETIQEVERALGEQWDLIISDYNLPGFFATDVLEKVKASGVDIPVIIVSGMIGEETAVAAMKAGAHDYLMKGSLQRLCPAIERELRDAVERRRRREAEAALRSQFSQISTIFDSLNVIVIVTDRESDRILFMNRQAEPLVNQQWSGLTCHDILTELSVEPPPEREIFYRTAGEESPPFAWEFKSERNERWYNCIDRVIRWPDERLVRMTVAIDITDQKEMERLKDEMISAVSHEMRTPLTAMLGFTEFLLENEVTPEQMSMALSTIHKETERLHELISNFLDLQKHKARREEYRIEPLDTCAVVEEARSLFAGEATRHPININCPEPVSDILGDEGKIHQLLNNLISNACKYSPDGAPIDIDVLEDDPYVVIRVKDRGKGIPADMREKIFDKFYRLDNTDRRQAGGTGLGLALVREIVTALHGEIRVLDNPGGGSIFEVKLPAARESSRTDGAPPPPV
ncbi:MAG: PAS domain-containing sensor histidine kinase [Desulfuromonadia bacterium]